MGDTQESISTGERISALESKILDMERRLAALERPSQSIVEPQSPPLGLTPQRMDSVKSPISVTLLSKSFHKANLLAGDSGDRIDFVLVFNNGFDRDVRAFKGTIVISDLFDQVIMRVTLTQEEGIHVGRTSEWRGGIPYNQFLAPHQRLLTVELKDISATLELDNVIFMDGTRESFAR